ncbi:decarboxylating NADP(+)-dependent phosphogluconate dehydrogenase [Buchnera aphidicola]|uniref:6-phosphogluconate dehydrogenase, decarboxylating n=1 Tax=Buchnera aphidicola (Therioaphis trifolii) TaxID=1241884 RepID=A0A4D6YCS4_9GAMM|nr:decarboxylating NADP(+)-dependent phosphogluconate dehydrogenase [Buchnera aphidicola]QCI27089.1 decarboxylating NADP(+)-dependent phosphogluconate dehydrogenase [Buchnera aphidicola (Therioaphis trifolii)]
MNNDIGVIGMAVMGRNLALNIANHGYNVSIFNRTVKKTKDVVYNNPKKTIFPFFFIKDFLNSLKKPRCIFLMVQSGSSVDNVISSLIPYLNSGDIIIDGGNSFYKDTIRRYHELLKDNINFIGAGISGGEYGALTGPSIMPGGKKVVYNIIKPILKSISSKFDNEDCVSYIGPDGSGHYVKMVHNGIEYADMQLISETYSILKNILNLNNEEISNIFSFWNKGELKSYLIEITKNILLKKDGKHDLIDCILDSAVNKGTGKWTCKNALDLEESLTIITNSVFSRYLSSLKSQRTLASKILSGPKINSIIHNQEDFIEKLRQALYLGKIISYSQGFSQLGSASKKYFWNLKCGNIAKIFRSGCIIQAACLNKIVDIYKYDDIIINLLFSPYFQDISNKYHSSLREIVSYVIKQGISIPAFSSAITYYDGYRTKESSANLIQAQRDYFGAHTYKRYDKEGIYHTNWIE